MYIKSSKKLKKTIFIITAIILISISNGYSQYIHFSQFYATPTLLSPSFAGSAKNSRVILNYRDQWPSIPGTFVTFAAAYDQHFYKIKSGFGVLAVRDQAGSGNLARTDFGVLYSYYFQLDKTTKLFFRPGVQFKISQIYFSATKFSPVLTPMTLLQLLRLWVKHQNYISMRQLLDYFIQKDGGLEQLLTIYCDQTNRFGIIQ